ncbi:MAG: hypothetical protein KKH28_07655 [Elusimicrobia bacterium]|nr:hypothetical protein [Elusimicrobiota bacterium]
MKLKSALILFFLLGAFTSVSMAGESRLWTQELNEPSNLYASPKLDYFVIAYKGEEDEIPISSGIAVYGQKWNKVWQDTGVVFEDISWYAGVISVRIPDSRPLGGGEVKVASEEASGAEESGGKWRILDVYTGKTLREYAGYQEGKAALNALDLFHEEEASKESWLRLTGPDWRVSAITDDGRYLTASNPLLSGYSCQIYKRSVEPGVFWKQIGPCGGGTLINGGHLLHGENIIPTDSAEMAEFVEKKMITLKVALKSLDDKEIWSRKISLKHELNNHVLLDYPLAWYSVGKIVVYTGLVLKLFDLEGKEGAQIPYASDMENAKKYENKVRGALAPRLAVSGDGAYFKFYCWDEEDDGKFKRRVLKLYKGILR